MSISRDCFSYKLVREIKKAADQDAQSAAFVLVENQLSLPASTKERNSGRQDGCAYTDDEWERE